jgi:hypothetical protein
MRSNSWENYVEDRFRVISKGICNVFGVNSNFDCGFDILTALVMIVLSPGIQSPLGH